MTWCEPEAFGVGSNCLYQLCQNNYLNEFKFPTTTYKATVLYVEY